MIFSTTVSDYLADQLKAKQGKLLIKQFTDGEIYVKVQESVQNKDVWVLASTQSPPRNFFELLLLLDALEREGARINIIITYFGYARQDRAEHGEALSAQVMSNCLNLFKRHNLFTFHIHNPEIKKFIQFDNIIPYEFFNTYAQYFDCIATPDAGASVLARSVAEMNKKECVIFLEKKRPEHEKVVVSIKEGTVSDKSVLLVDDMISTGRTMIQAAQALKDRGAKSISVAATHGLFVGNAILEFENSCIDNVYVTNTVPPKQFEKCTVFNIAPLIDALIPE